MARHSYKKDATAETGLAECWDEYLVPTAVRTDDVTSLQLVFALSLGNTETSLPLSGPCNAQSSWHFPAGPGLTEEVQCPRWEFPAVSYYPSMVTATPFEATWRVWEDVGEDDPAAEPDLIPFPFQKTSIDFTVMSYNILAQDLLEANQELYRHCPLEVLDWSYRCSLLLKEIQKWSPDILCLQEVQENHYYETLQPALSQMGYTCVFKCRTGAKTDGCATCYRSCRFSEASVTELEFFRPETALLDRHNVGIVSLLRPVVAQGHEGRRKGPPLCVANTHLLFNPRRGDVKLAQLAIVLAEVDRTVKLCQAYGEEDCSVIVCGDCNSVPHSPLYQLITSGKLYYKNMPSWMVSGQEDLSHKAHFGKLSAPLWPRTLGVTDTCQYFPVETGPESHIQNSGTLRYKHDFMLSLRYCPAACVRPQSLRWIPKVTDITPDPSGGNHTYEQRFRHSLGHRLDLDSVYKHTVPSSGRPEVTTLHSESGATVDYIFYSPQRAVTTQQKAAGASKGLKLTGCLSLLSEDVLWSMHGLPNNTFPSDHLSLLARFQLDVDTARRGKDGVGSKENKCVSV